MAVPQLVEEFLVTESVVGASPTSHPFRRNMNYIKGKCSKCGCNINVVEAWTLTTHVKPYCEKCAAELGRPYVRKQSGGAHGTRDLEGHPVEPLYGGTTDGNTESMHFGKG